MGFFQRLANLWNGFLSLWISDVENRNPEVVYEAAINEQIKKHKEIKKAVSRLVFLRNQTSDKLKDREKELDEISEQIPVAVEAGDDEAALTLIERQEVLTHEIAQLSDEFKTMQAQAEEAKNSLVQFQSRIEALRREKEEKLAQKATAEAKIEINEALSGMSIDADMQALDNVRASIDQLKAEADVTAELNESGLESRLNDIKDKTRSKKAVDKLEAMKKQMAARKQASENAAAVKKTM